MNRAGTNTDLILRILARIQAHDATAPIAGHVLASEFGLNIRQIQAIVEQLRDAGHKVGSSMSAPAGYFLARGPEDMIETIEHYRERIRIYASRINRMRDWKTTQPSIWEQPMEGDAA